MRRKRTPGSKYTFKIVIGGAGGVGKTTLLHRFLHNAFLTDTSMTIGVSFQSKEITRDGTRIMLSLWDLGGQERFRLLQPQFCLGAKAAIVFFDLTRLDTFFQVKDWVDMIRAQSSPNVPIILGSTKFDLIDEDKLDSSNEYAMKAVDELGLSCYFMTSSKTGMNVEEIFNYVVENLLQQVNQGKAPAMTSIE